MGRKLIGAVKRERRQTIVASFVSIAFPPRNRIEGRPDELYGLGPSPRPIHSRHVRQASSGLNEAKTKGRGDMLGPFVQFFVGTQILLVAASGPPTINIEATCQASEKDLLATFGTSVKDVTVQCVKQENDALETIKKNWATYPAAAKTLCVQPGVYSASYVEWLTCLEMDVDVRRIRAENAKAEQDVANAKAAENAKAAQAKAPPRRRSPNSRSRIETKQCPVVQFQEDGSVASVIIKC